MCHTLWWPDVIPMRAAIGGYVLCAHDWGGTHGGRALQPLLGKPAVAHSVGGTDERGLRLGGTGFASAGMPVDGRHHDSSTPSVPKIHGLPEGAVH